MNKTSEAEGKSGGESEGRKGGRRERQVSKTYSGEIKKSLVEIWQCMLEGEIDTGMQVHNIT